jgi:phage tail-like protein
MPERKDPYRNSRFLLEIDGIIQAGFTEATVPDASTDVVEYRDGSEEPRFRKLSGLNKFSNITLKWGTTDSMEMYVWRKLVMDGKLKEARRNIAVILMDAEGKPAARWEFENAWPSKYDPADLNAKGNDAAIASLEIVHEGMKRVS